MNPGSSIIPWPVHPLLQFKQLYRLLPLCHLAWIGTLHPARAVSKDTIPAAPGNSIPTFQLETWDTDDGLPQNSVLSLEQDHNGYLWFGTLFGLVRFDGIHCEVFDKTRIPSLPDDVVNSLSLESDHTLVWGTQNGICRFNSIRLETPKNTTTLPSGNVLKIIPRSRGGSWVLLHDQGGTVAYVNGNQSGTVPVEFEGAGPVDIAEDNNDGLWFAEQRGIIHFDLNTREQERVPFPSNDSWAGAVVSHGDQIVAGGEGQIFIRVQNQWKRYPLQGALKGQDIHHLSIDRQGGIWVSCSLGVARFFKGVWYNYPLPERFAKNRCSAVLQDSNGDFWFGSRDNGLHRIRHATIEVWTKESGLKHDSIWSICQGSADDVWIGTGGGLSRRQDLRVYNFGFSQGVPRPWITTVCQRRSGALWFGMRTGGEPAYAEAPYLGFIKEHEVKLLQPESMTEVTRVWTIFEDDSESLWIGTNRGLFNQKSDRFERVHLAEEEESHDIRVIFQDDDRSMWFGSNGAGLFRLQDGTVHHFDSEDGLSNENVWALHPDSDGGLWIGTEAGLNYLFQNDIHALSQQHGLFDDLANQILEDDFGNLWISCNRGIYRVKKKRLKELINGQRSRIEHVAYGTADGMLSAETNGECQPAGCKLSDGRLAFPTGRGVVLLDPKRLLSDESAPQIVIESLRTNGRVLHANALDGPFPTKQLEMQPGSGRLVEISYTATQFISPTKCRFSYRLEGHHREWIDAGTRRTALYSNLPPGDYKFQVRATDHRGVQSKEVGTLTFNIQPYFYQTTVFWLTSALVSLGILGWWHRHVVRRRVLLAKMEDQIKLNEERSRIARDMHDEIGTTLTQISMLSELANRTTENTGNLETTLGRIKKSSKGLVESVDEIVWATNPKHDTLESFIAYFTQFATEFLRTTDVAFAVHAPPPSEHLDTRLPSETRHHLFLAAKESIHNAVKHSQASRIELNCQFQDDRLFSIAIHDNGIGLPSNLATHANRGNGLKNIVERMTKIRGNATFTNQPAGG